MVAPIIANKREYVRYLVTIPDRVFWVVLAMFLVQLIIP